MTTTQAAARRPSRGRRIATRLIPLLIVLGLGSYVAACALAPLPEPELRLEVAETEVIEADESSTQAAVDSQPLPTAVGWLDGDKAWANDDNVYSLASLSKLITVLVGIEEQPLEPGADGPVYTWTQHDRERQDYYISLDGVAFPIEVGTKITMRQMLTFIFLPSSNDYAEAYANWVFGDNETFLAAVEDWKERHGFDSLEFVEPTGMDEGNKANVTDLLSIARMVLENPTLAEFTGTASAEMPWGIGVIENTNPLLTTEPDIIGVKTGRSLSAGFNFIAAQRAEAGDREIVKMSVTLGRGSVEERAQSGRDMLALIDPLPQQVEVTTEGEQVGTLTSVDGQVVRLLVSESTSVWLLPGEAATRTVSASRDGSSISIEAPGVQSDVLIHHEGEITEPDLWWRLTNPGLLFG